MKALGFVSLAAAIVLLGLLLRLAALDRAGPVHVELSLEGGIPATLYLPGDPGAGVDRTRLPDPPPRGERPPAVLLAHGFASDRAGTSALARSLAAYGYAVLALDFRGHGTNRNSFGLESVRSDLLISDLDVAVTYLRSAPWVDGSRLVLMGHSMGASAVLTYATRDPALDGVVPISGGWRIAGPYSPPNALFLYAEGDPERIRARASRLAASLTERDALEPGRTYGSFADGTAVRRVEIAGEDHVSIIASDAAVTEIVAWLDRIFAPESGGEGARGGAVARGGEVARGGGRAGAAEASIEAARRAGIVDPRLAVAWWGALAFLLVVPGLGIVVGRLAPAMEERPASGALVRILLFAGALLVPLPVVALGRPGLPLSLEVADVTAPHLALAGGLVLVVSALCGRLAAPDLLDDWMRNARAALAGLVALYVLLVPLAVAFHSLSPTPERLLLAAMLWALLLPFGLAFHWLLRRGGVLASTLTCVAGRVLIAASLALGVASGIFPTVIGLVVPLLAVLFALFELLSASAYAVRRNFVAPAVLEAATLAWLLAATLPVRL